MRRRLAQLLDKLDLNLKLLEAYLIVKDPAAPKSAEAFQGLADKVDGAYRQRRRLLAMLADVHRIAWTTRVNGDNGRDNPVLAKIEEYLTAEGVEIVCDFSPGHDALFQIVGDRADRMLVSSPAYVSLDPDPRLNELIRQGIAVPDTSPPTEQRESAEPHSMPADDATPTDDAVTVDADPTHLDDGALTDEGRETA